MLPFYTCSRSKSCGYLYKLNQNNFGKPSQEIPDRRRLWLSIGLSVFFFLAEAIKEGIFVYSKRRLPGIQLGLCLGELLLFLMFSIIGVWGWRNSCIFPAAFLLWNLGRGMVCLSQEKEEEGRERKSGAPPAGIGVLSAPGSFIPSHEAGSCIRKLCL